MPTRPPVTVGKWRPRDSFSPWSLIVSVAAHVVVLGALYFVLSLVPLPRILERVLRPTTEQVQYFDIAFPAGEGDEEGAAPETPEPAPEAAPVTEGSGPSPPGAPRSEDEALGPFPTASPSDGPFTAPSGGVVSPGGDAPPAGTPSARGSAREALRPGYRDARLWVDPGALGLEVKKSQHREYMEHLQARIDGINDSIYGEAARARAVTDWTRTDKDGKRWGLSPEGLHLGGITVPRALIPLPAATGDNQQIEAERQKQRQREEIQRQEADRARRKIQEERAKAIRERKEAERKKGGG